MTADNKMPENISLVEHLTKIEANQGRMEDIVKARAGLEVIGGGK